MATPKFKVICEPESGDCRIVSDISFHCNQFISLKMNLAMRKFVFEKAEEYTFQKMILAILEIFEQGLYHGDISFADKSLGFYWPAEPEHFITISVEPLKYPIGEKLSEVSRLLKLSAHRNMTNRHAFSLSGAHVKSST